MPELPEVETIRRDLDKRIKGLEIVKVEILDRRVVRHRTEIEFVRHLAGKKFTGVLRRGKALIFNFEGTAPHLVVQLMMTGQFLLTASPTKVKATKVVFTLSNDQYLIYNDHRLFGRLQVVEDLATFPYLMKLGPEPLGSGFSSAWLAKNVLLHRTAIKKLLLDHHFVAGIGNIYASEILFAAGILPQRPANSLSAKEAARLHHSVREVLKLAVQHRGTSMNTYRDADGQEGQFLSFLKVYGREGEACSDCRRLIKKEVMSGRSTFFCETCQQ